MPTTKPVLGYSGSYGIPNFKLETADRLALYKLAEIDDDQRGEQFCKTVEDVVALFKAEAKDLEKRPTDSQIRAALRRTARHARAMQEFLCHPSDANGKNNQLDRMSRLFINKSLRKLSKPADTIAAAAESL